MGDTRRRKLPVILAILAALAVGFAAPASASFTSLAPAPPIAAPIVASSLTASVETPTPPLGTRLSWSPTPTGPRPYFGARYYASKIGRFTTVDPAYTIPENLVDPQRWNRYAYARNNPLKYVDPDGRAIDIAVDVVSIGYDLFDIGRSVYRGEGVSGTQVGALGADILGAAIPFATGGGAAFRAAVKAERAVEDARAGFIAANRARGVESEARVLSGLGEAKNTAKVRGCEGCSIPDYQNATTIGEIKDAARVDNTRQLRIQREAATASGRQHVVQTGTRTKVSGEVEKRGSVVKRRDDLGPK